MVLHPAPSRSRYLIYVEANALFYWSLPTSSSPDEASRDYHDRCHAEVSRLVDLCSRHKGPIDRITFVTSQWALTEVHSVLYKDELLANSGRLPPLPTDPRHLFPHDRRCLEHATQVLNNRIKRELADLVDLRVDQPSAEVWLTAHRISEECAIHAPDCLHLATALYSGCELFVTEDMGFLNKIHRNLVHRSRPGPLAAILRDIYPLTDPQNLQHAQCVGPQSWYVGLLQRLLGT